MTLTTVVLCGAALLCVAVPTQAQQTGSSRELAPCLEVQNKFVDARAHQDVDGMAALFAPDAIRVTPEGIFLGRDAIRQNLQHLVTAGLHDFTTQRTVSRLEGGILFDAGGMDRQAG